MCLNVYGYRMPYWVENAIKMLILDYLGFYYFIYCVTACLAFSTYFLNMKIYV